MALFDKLRPIADRVAAFGDGPMPFNTVIDEILSATEVMIDGRRTLLCGSNNYLGLSFHPQVLAAAQQAIVHDGAGTTGSRAANGTWASHRRLEEAFAALYGKTCAMVFTTGYQANLGLISGLCGPDDAIVVDLESHASIYDGAKLSGAQLYQFRHNSPSDLARKLRKLPDPSSCLVVIEGLYSISGDVAPVKDILAVCHEAGAYLVVDEAHSFGAYGPRGLGCAEAEGVLDEVDFIVGTFSKTLAGIGGYAVSSHRILTQLHFAARPYVFTASGSPANIAGVHAALEVMQRDPSLRTRLWDNVRRMRSGLLKLGFTIGPTESPIVPIVVGASERAVEMWQALLEAGIYVNIVLPPGCRPDACLLRSSYSAAHSREQIDHALSVFEEVGKALRLIGAAA